MAEVAAVWQRLREVIAPNLRRYARIARLKPSTELVMLLTTTMAALWIAADGVPPLASLLLFVLAALVAHGFTWVANDLLESRLFAHSPDSVISRGMLGEREALRLLLVLAVLGLLLAWALAPLLLYATPLLALVLLSPPLVKRYSALAQLALGGATAMPILMAYLALGRYPDQVGGLLFVAAWLWASAWHLLYAIPRARQDAEAGMGSLVHLLGEGSTIVVGVLQLGSVWALWLATGLAKWGLAIHLALALAVVLSLYQQFMLRRNGTRGAVQAYRLNVFWGIAIFVGFVVQFALPATEVAAP